MDELVEIGARALYERFRVEEDTSLAGLPFEAHQIAFKDTYAAAYRDAAQAILSALSARGLAVVPVEPSLSMLCHGKGADMKDFRGETPVREIYQAMVAAALPKEGQ